MTDGNKHWNALFSANTDSKLGWYESDVSQTLKFLDIIDRDFLESHNPHKTNTTTFLPGAGTSLLVDELLSMNHKLVLNDISNEALLKLKTRTGKREGLIWLHHDIAQPLPDDIPQVDIWIDRAVLHFLIEEADIQGYFRNLNTVVRPGGYALLAEFSEQGVKRCAGLEIHRYSIAEMNERLGEEFTLIKYERYEFINLEGDPRPYIYALYKRNEH